MEMKRCCACKQNRSTADFSRLKSAVDGLEPTCKPCRSEQGRDQRARDRERLGDEAFAARAREKALRIAHGITQEQWDEQFEAQGKCCALCGSPVPRREKSGWSTDHNHQTGALRAILCHICNLFLGFAEKPDWEVPSPSVLARYLADDSWEKRLGRC